SDGPGHAEVDSVGARVAVGLFDTVAQIAAQARSCPDVAEAVDRVGGGRRPVLQLFQPEPAGVADRAAGIAPAEAVTHRFEPGGRLHGTVPFCESACGLGWSRGAQT